MSFDFSSIGLDTRDKRVYEALLSNQEASLRAIAETTGINRGTVHESIKQMHKIGLVSYYEAGKQRRYIAQDPDIIPGLLQEHRQKLRDAERDAIAYIDQLKVQSYFTPYQSFASFYEGDSGVAIVLRDVLATVNNLPDKQYEVISSKHVREYIYQNFSNFTRRRVTMGLYVRVIAMGEGGDIAEQSNRKWLSSNGTDAPPNCYTIIYGNKTAFISLSDSNHLQTLVVDNAGLTAMQRTMFEQLWTSL